MIREIIGKFFLIFILLSIIMKNLKLIKKQDKYNLILALGNKTKIIGNSNSKTELKQKASTTLHKITKDILKLNNKIIYQLSIKKGNKTHPLVIVIEQVQIIVKDKKDKLTIKFKKLGEMGNSKVYIDNKFIENHKKINDKYLKKIVLKYHKGKLNVAFSIHTLSNL
mgnify:CR=1 FL=1